MTGKTNTLLNNNMNEILNKNKNNSEASLIKPLFKELSESKASEVTLKNSSEIELNEDTNCTHDISKSKETITTSKNSTTSLSIIKKRSDTKEVISDKENKNNDMLDKSKSSSKKGKYTPELKNKYLKNGRSTHSSSEKVSPSTNKLSKTSKSSNTLLNHSIPSSTTTQRSKTATTTTTSTTSTIKTKRNSLYNSLDITSTNNNNNNNNHSFSHSSSTNNISTSLAKKTINIHSSSQENNVSKKIPYKVVNSIRTSLLSNKPLMNQSSRKTLKSELRKNTSSQNDLSSHLDRNKSIDYIHNRNDSQQKSKKLTSFQRESNPINEKEIVLKSNEYRRAIAKINSLEKTIKQLQTQHSETLASLHSEIARLQRACSEKTLVEAFKGTGLLTSLSEKYYPSQDNCLSTSIASINDQDIILNTINSTPKGMNLLPKIQSTKKNIDKNNDKDKDEESNNNTVNKKNDINNSINSSNKISEIKSSNEENKSYNDSVGINNIKNSRIDNNDRINDQKKKMANNIKAHKYNSIEKLNSNSNSNSNSDTTLETNYDENPSLSDDDLSIDTASSHNSMQTYVSLSDASTAVALSSGHSSSLSSLIKSEMALNRQLPPPLPPNYPKSSIRLSESPRHLINLPKIIQPITKVKENKNTSINLPSLIKNKTSKNSHRY